MTAKKITKTKSRKKLQAGHGKTEGNTSPNLPAGPAKKNNRNKFHIAGIGASAGGLDAFERFFINMPADSGIGFVLLSHLDPDHASMMPEILKKSTKMTVVQAEDGMQVKPDHVYVIPPNKHMAIFNGILQLSSPPEPRGLRMPVDYFFRSLAEDLGDRAICVILSGSGMDGTAGLKAIHGAGGLSIVQAPETAGYDGMPRSAISTGLADYVLPVEEMPSRMIGYITLASPRKGTAAVTVPERQPRSYDKILMLLRSNTGHDFSLYKKNTILRRIERRMNLHNIDEPAAFFRFLQEHPGEIQLLFKELIIQVTSFFRDPKAFEVLKTDVLPKLLQKKPEGYTVRVWVPACGTGEEAVSIAVVLREYIDDMKQDVRIQIFGTDIDEDAINTARSGIYPDSIATEMSPERLQRFFLKEDSAYRVRNDIRESIVYAAQNIIKDPPFTKLDLLSCRNLLIYLDTELQNRIIPLFHYSLKPGGILFLGSSEGIGGFVDLFGILDKKWRFFQRRDTASAAQPAVFTGPPLRHEAGFAVGASAVKKSREGVGALAQKMLLEHFSPPCAIVNEQGDIVFIQGRTGKYLEPASGKASLNILQMARKGLAFELRSALRKAISRKKEITVTGLQIKSDGGVHGVNVTVRPVKEFEEMHGLLMVVFEDLPVKKEKPPKKEKAAQGEIRRIEELESELKYTKESLQSMVAELQAYNEELKSANEEMQSTNEEMQSTNEELDTSREEIQSVNEELVTVNSELQARLDQLAQSENDMRILIDSTNTAIIFLDAELNVQRFTPEATKVINLIPSDIGRPVGHIVAKLMYENLVEDARRVLSTLIFRETEVQTKDGRWYKMRIMPYRTADNVIDGVIIIFYDIHQIKQAAEDLKKLNRELQASREYSESIVETVREPLIVLDSGFRVITANHSFYTLYEYKKEETEGRLIFELGNKQWDIPELRKLLEDILPRDTFFENFRVEMDLPQAGKKTILLNARKIFSEHITEPMILLAMSQDTASPRLR
jgi:two-component system, chemotaxis family, CheB/CheR fusion protein